MKFFRDQADEQNETATAVAETGELEKRIVEAHHGHVDFDTYLGKGSEFRIRLKTI